MQRTIIFKLLKVLLNSFIAGIIFAICGAAYLYTGGFVGAMILSVGFILCMLYAYDAFIIKIPYVLENNPMYLIETIISLVGNIVGSICVALLLYLTPLYDNNLILEAMKNQIIDLNHFEVILYGLISGVLVYFGINTYKKAEQPIARFLVLILCVTASVYFGLCQISYDAFFFSAAGVNGNLWSKFFTILIGNTLGLLLIPLLRKLRSKF